jgi:hypothetical protein
MKGISELTVVLAAAIAVVASPVKLGKNGRESSDFHWRESKLKLNTAVVRADAGLPTWMRAYSDLSSDAAI